MSTTDEQRVQFSNWFHKTFASPPMGFYPFAEAAWYAGQSAFAQQAPPPAVSEPAAPVDARDALIGEINNLAYHGTMYLSERESGNVRLCFADIISKIESHRDSLAHQAAAPAKGEK